MKLLGVELVEKGSTWREQDDELWMCPDGQITLHKVSTRAGTYWSAGISVAELNIRRAATGSTPEEAELKLSDYLERLARCANQLRNFAK